MTYGGEQTGEKELELHSRVGTLEEWRKSRVDPALTNHDRLWDDRNYARGYLKVILGGIIFIAGLLSTGFFWGCNHIKFTVAPGDHSSEMLVNPTTTFADAHRP